MPSNVTTSCFRASPAWLYDRVQSLEQLCRRAAGQPSSSAQGATLERTIVSSGLPSLDRLLPGGGIRLGSIIDWLEPAGESGVEKAAGAAAFALAVAVRLQSIGSLPASRPIVVVDRGGRFYPPAVLPWLTAAEPTACHEEAVVGRRQRRGNDSPASLSNSRRELRGVRADRRLYVIRPDSEADEIWAIDQALRCPGVAAVVGWPQRVAATPLRRWQLAAKASGVVGLFVRPAVTRQQPTWSEVRVQVQPAVLAGRANTSPSRPWTKSAAAGCDDQPFRKPSMSFGVASVNPASWIDVRAYRLVRVGGGWEAAMAVAEPAVDCLLDLTSGRECIRSAVASLQPDWSRGTNRKELACRAS